MRKPPPHSRCLCSKARSSCQYESDLASHSKRCSHPPSYVLLLRLLADNTLPPADPAADFSDFGPLPSFTPLVSQQAAGRVSNPFAASGGGYMMERSSLRTSQDISMLLRSGMLMEAALLSSNASRMHIIHDAGGDKWTKKPSCCCLGFSELEPQQPSSKCTALNSDLPAKILCSENLFQHGMICSCCA